MPYVVIGCGITLNDAGSGNVPYIQFESVGDFIPEPRCSKSAVGLQTRRRKMGCTRDPVGSGRKAKSDKNFATS